MKNTIAFKLFKWMLVFVMLILVLSWSITSTYLEKFYLKEQLKHTIELAKEFKEQYSSGELLEAEIYEKASINFGGTVTLQSIDGGKVEQIHKNGFGQGMGKANTIDASVLEKVRNDEIVVYRIDNNRWGVSIQRLIFRLNESIIVIVDKPITEIDQSLNSIKQFYMIIIWIAIPLSVIFAFVLSKRFAKPIVELSNVANEISQLNFDRHIGVYDTYEISNLGNSIERLSNNLKEALESLNKSNAHLKTELDNERKIDEMRKIFISNVSHELKSPISLIKGYAEGLSDNINDDLESREYYCQVISEEANLMDDLVKDLLDLSQLETGQFKLYKTEVDINNMLLDIYTKFEKQLGLEVNISSSFITSSKTVNADRRRLEQVVVNFLSNAIKFSDGEVILKTEKNNEKLKIIIYNSGKNINSEEIESIWQPFYKTDKSRNREDGGTGLGLSIVKGILECHGFDYGVENVDGGVEFWFSL